jgi:hypothetical protein
VTDEEWKAEGMRPDTSPRQPPSRPLVIVIVGILILFILAVLASIIVANLGDVTM